MTHYIICTTLPEYLGRRGNLVNLAFDPNIERFFLYTREHDLSHGTADSPAARLNAGERVVLEIRKNLKPAIALGVLDNGSLTLEELTLKRHAALLHNIACLLVNDRFLDCTIGVGDLVNKAEGNLSFGVPTRAEITETIEAIKTIILAADATSNNLTPRLRPERKR